MLGGRGRGAEGLFQEGRADAQRATDFFQSGRSPRLALHHLGEQGQANGDKLAVLGQPLDGRIDKRLVLGPEPVGSRRQSPVGPAERCQYDPRVRRVEQVHQCAVFSFDQPDLQGPHEPAGGEPEVVAHQDDGLHVLTVALTECVGQTRAAPRLDSRRATARTGRARSALSGRGAAPAPAAARPATRQHPDPWSAPGRL